ncbi:hypothetical protein Tco_0466401 [Tanacetum coccineum]
MVVWLENSSLNRLGDYIRLGCVDGKVPFTSVVLRIHRIPVDIVIVILKLVRSTRCSLRDPTLVSEFGISSWRGSRVDGRSCLLSGAIDGSEANRIIRDSKSCKVRVGSNGNLLWEASILLGRKVHEDDVAKTVFRMRNGHVEVYGYAFWVNQCTSSFHGVNEPGGVRVAREDDREVTEGREDVREVFQQCGSGAKRNLSRRGRNQLSNEPILALPEGADDFVVYYDAQSKDLEACLEKKGEVIAFTSQQLKVLIKNCMANVMLYRGVGRRSEAKNEFEIDIRRSDLGRLWVVEGLTLERGHELKHNMIVLAKVRGDSKRGPEFTWERKDQMRSKCPQLFVDSANASSS